ncbi:MAG: TadE/TadG family type IV pilus assembly protein [Chloroflexota bacterium]
MVKRKLRALRQRGQTVVELALLLPILSLLMMGALDLGRAYYYYAGVTNAARVGAQYAMLMDPAVAGSSVGQAEIKQAVVAEASPYVTIGADRVTLTTPEGWVTGKDIKVTAVFDYRFITPGASRLWGEPLVITCQSTARFE